MVAMHWAWFLFFPGAIVILAVIVGVILLAVRATAAPAAPAPPYPQPPMQGGPARETPLEILARRFASGEITAEEYQKARDLLSS